MKFYVVLVNGEVATLAKLSDEDAAKLKQWAAEQGVLDRIQVVQSDVATTLYQAQVDTESVIETWSI